MAPDELGRRGSTEARVVSEQRHRDIECRQVSVAAETIGRGDEDVSPRCHSKVTPAPSEIVTARLRLRRPEPSDLSDCHATWSCPEVVRFIGGRPSKEEEVWDRLLRYAGLWSLLGFGYWIMRNLENDDFVGEVGFADVGRGIAPPLGRDPEIGWALTPRAWGRGYAREAIEAATGWMDRIYSAPATVCIIAPENIRSIRLASRCGYELRSTVTYNSAATQVYRRVNHAE